MVQNDGSHQRKTHHRAYAHAGEDNGIRLAALAHWKPPLDELARRRIHRGFSRAKGEAHQNEDEQRVPDPSRNKRNQGQEERPPRTQPSQCATRAKPSREQARRNLKSGIADEKCARDPAQLDLADRELLANLDAGDRNIGAVQIRDSA